MPGANASIAMKCVAQIPNPVDVADTASHRRRVPVVVDLRT